MKQRYHWTDSIELFACALAIVFVLFALSSMSYGQERVDVRLVVAHEDCVKYQDYFRDVLNKMQPMTNKKYRIVRRTCSFPIDNVQTLDNRVTHFWKWNKEIRRREFITVVLEPTIYQDGIYYVAGMSKESLKLAVVQVDKDMKQGLSDVAIMHELAHLLGATDDFDCLEPHMMCGDALKHSTKQKLYFNEKSLREMK